MSTMQDRYYSHEIELEQGVTAYVHCDWIDQEPGHVASEVTVVVRQGDIVEEIGSIKGPIRREAANEQGAKLAKDWYAMRKGDANP